MLTRAVFDDSAHVTSHLFRLGRRACFEMSIDPSLDSEWPKMLGLAHH